MCEFELHLNSVMSETKECRKIRSTAKKFKLIKLHGGKCIKCGYSNRHILQFHHIDPSNKEFAIGRNDFSFNRLLEESKKCILLCPNCHILEHSTHKVVHDIDRKRKHAMLQYLNKFSCSKCNCNKSESILEFHHIVPSTKLFNLQEYRGSHVNLSSEVKNELDKCEVLCRNCHMEVHMDFDFYSNVESIIEDFNINEYIKLDEDEVLSLFIEGESVTRIANKLKVNKSTISTILSRLGKGSYKLSEITVDKNEMIMYIQQGLNNSEISKKMKCHNSTVSRFRKKLTVAKL